MERSYNDFKNQDFFDELSKVEVVIIDDLNEEMFVEPYYYLLFDVNNCDFDYIKLSFNSLSNNENEFSTCRMMISLESSRYQLIINKSIINKILDYYNGNMSEETHKLTIVDNYNILLEPLKNEYKAGEIVRVKLRFFSGLCAGIKANEKLIETPVEAEAWKYQIYAFVMPDEDVTLYTTINGYTDK